MVNVPLAERAEVQFPYSFNESAVKLFLKNIIQSGIAQDVSYTVHKNYSHRIIENTRSKGKPVITRSKRAIVLGITVDGEFILSEEYMNRGVTSLLFKGYRDAIYKKSRLVDGIRFDAVSGRTESESFARVVTSVFDKVREVAEGMR